MNRRLKRWILGALAAFALVMINVTQASAKPADDAMKNNEVTNAASIAATEDGNSALNNINIADAREKMSALIKEEAASTAKYTAKKATKATRHGYSALAPEAGTTAQNKAVTIAATDAQTATMATAAAAKTTLARTQLKA